MNFMKRGLQSLWAKKGRSLILIAVFSAILIFVLAGLTIKSAADTATDTAKKSVGATVTLSTNREQMFKKDSDSDDASDESTSRPDPGSFQMTPVNLADAEKIAALDGVKSYSFEVSTSATKGDDIEPISSSDEEDTTADSATDGASQGENGMPGGGMMGGASGMDQGDFQITGVLESAAYSSFSAGTATLTSGEALTAEDVDTNNVLIESALAEANDLAVGDTFTLVDANDENVEVTIKGIYETSDTGTSMGMQFNFMNPANTIFSAYTLANTIAGEEGDTIDSAVYTLADPNEMDSFVKEAESLIDTDTFSLQTNDQMYQQMLTPLNNVSSFAKNIIILVAAAGVIILTLIVMMTIRERRYEIGVLLSLGEGRGKVILQFFTEIFVCMLLALGIASASGNLVGNVVGNQLLEQQTTQTASADQGAPGGEGQGQAPSGGRGQGGPGQMISSTFSQSEEIKDLDITVSGEQIALLAAIGLGISFVSILLSLAGIMRLNPKKILIS
ncbi:ABC transporter permease [Enterococcus asini]|uniref:ABC transporter permease n=1 Tax=Enterococcus asini TaxID=57732 RepID=UPI00288DDFC4|nr:ABC transporter permease [Enterococcus asini]MDT2763828.1 ABC transporter permease [Enterococcus asini]